ARYPAYVFRPARFFAEVSRAAAQQGHQLLLHELRKSPAAARVGNQLFLGLIEDLAPYARFPAIRVGTCHGNLLSGEELGCSGSAGAETGRGALPEVAARRQTRNCARADGLTTQAQFKRVRIVLIEGTRGP